MYLESFPKKKYLHPYERSLIELTLGDGNYEEVNSYQFIVNILFMQSFGPLQCALPSPFLLGPMVLL